MIEKALVIITDEMQKINVPYEFMQWTSTVEDRYWVGEFTETPTDTEDGYEEGTLMLTGTTSGSWSTLMQDRKKIKNHFPNMTGFGKNTDNGVVVIFYSNSLPIPTGEANLKRIQINLQIKAWKGMN